MKISLRHCLSQTVRARELKVLKNVTWHGPHVKLDVSCVMCPFFILFYIKLLDLVDFAVQSANSGIGSFASRVLNLTQSIHKKVKTYNGKSVDI